MNLMKVVLFFSAVIFVVYGYPSGAPTNVCGRYVPGHRNMGTPVGNGPRTGPFTLTAEPQGNGLFKVTLRASTALPMKGFLIQAIQSWKQLPDSAGDVVGMFQQDFGGLSQLRRCNTPSGSNVVTHTSNDSKTVVDVVWRAPFNLPDPGVKFVATVVQDYDNFFVVYSSPIQVTDEFGSASETAPGNTMSPFNNQNQQPTTFPATNPATKRTGLSQGQGQFRQGQGQFGQGQQFNQRIPGRQIGNAFGQQTRFGQQRFGMQGMRNPFDPRLGVRQGQGQMFGFQGGRQGQQLGGGFTGRQQQFGGLNLPMVGGSFGTGLNSPTGGSQFQGQPGTNQGQGQPDLGGQNTQQTGLQQNGAIGGQISSGSVFGGQFGTPVGQLGQGTIGQQFGQTGQFGQGQGFQDRRRFTPPGLTTNGRIQFTGFGQQQQQAGGQFGRFGQGQFGGQGPFRGGQGQLGGFNTFGRNQLGNGQRGTPFFNRGLSQGQFGMNSFLQNQGTSGQNNLNTFADVPAFGVNQGQGLGGQGTLTLGGQASNALNGQSSGTLFNQLSQPSGNSLTNFNTGTGNGQNNGLPNDQNQSTRGSGGLSSFAFGPFNPSTK